MVLCEDKSSRQRRKSSLSSDPLREQVITPKKGASHSCPLNPFSEVRQRARLTCIFLGQKPVLCVACPGQRLVNWLNVFRQKKEGRRRCPRSSCGPQEGSSRKMLNIKSSTFSSRSRTATMTTILFATLVADLIAGGFSRRTLSAGTPRPTIIWYAILW